MDEFGRRERQIMDVVYRLGRATVGDVMSHLPDPPTYSAVRAMLSYLERKGHLRHNRDGVRYVYEPTMPQAEAQRSAVQTLVRTFFRGSRRGAGAAGVGGAPRDGHHCAPQHRTIGRALACPRGARRAA